MTYLKATLVLVILVLIVRCNSNNQKSDKQQLTQNQEIEISYLDTNYVLYTKVQKSGSEIVTLSTNTLGIILKKTIKKDGAEKALEFCNHKAINITDSLSKIKNVIISRIAEKNRNPDNILSQSESIIYKNYSEELLAGKTLEPRIIIDENEHPVYYKPIIINKKCLTCHGTPGETMPHSIATKITELYPNDNAINFKDGDLRGMWAITFKNITLVKN